MLPFKSGIALRVCRFVLSLAASLAVVSISATAALAQAEGSTHHPGGEANLKLPDLSTVSFLGGINGHTLLLI